MIVAWLFLFLPPRFELPIAALGKLKWFAHVWRTFSSIMFCMVFLKATLAECLAAFGIRGNTGPWLNFSNSWTSCTLGFGVWLWLGPLPKASFNLLYKSGLLPVVSRPKSSNAVLSSSTFHWLRYFFGWDIVTIFFFFNNHLHRILNLLEKLFVAIITAIYSIGLYYFFLSPQTQLLMVFLLPQTLLLMDFLTLQTFAYKGCKLSLTTFFFCEKFFVTLWHLNLCLGISQTCQFISLSFFFSSTNFAAYGSQTLAYKFNIFCHRMSHLTGMIFVSNIFHFSLHDLLSGFRFFSKYFQIFCILLKSRSFFFYLFIKLCRVFWCYQLGSSDTTLSSIHK